MRHHNDPTKCPKQKTTQARKTTQAQKTPTSPATTTTARSTGALHPIRGAAPVTWRCTRTEEVHCLRIGCSAPTNKNKRGTGTPNHSPPHPSMRTWALLAAGWARRRRRHLHSGPLRHLPHPYMRRTRSVEGQRRGRLGFALAQGGQADQHEDDHRPPRTGHGEQAAACADRVDRRAGNRRAERGAQVDRG